MWAFDEYTLEELGMLGRGKSKHRPRNDPILYGGSYPFIQTGEIKAANLHVDTFEETYNDKGLSQSKLWDEGTLLITIAANIAETAILNIKACFPDSVVGFIPNEEIVDSYFIKYYIDYIKREMQSISQGTTQDNLSLEKLRTFKFKVPKDRNVVDHISNALKNYDNLIENNNRRIAILEEMAQSLYREWFVKFRYPGHQNQTLVDSPLGPMPERWEVQKLSEVATVNPESLTKKNAPGSIGYVDIASVENGEIKEIKYMPFTEAPSRARRIVRDGDIIWATVRPNRRQFSYICKPNNNTVVSTGFAVLRSKSIPASYLYFASTSHSFSDYLVNYATGSAYPAVNASVFEHALVLIPCAELLSKFEQFAQTVLIMVNSLKNMNNNLKEQRDMLLPKLISGTIIP